MNGKNINFNDKKLKKKLNFTKIKKYLIEINRHLVSILKNIYLLFNNFKIS